MNELTNDLYNILTSMGADEKLKRRVFSKYKDSWEDIYMNMYIYFNKEDKKLFCRFLLKRFFGIHTALDSEKEFINSEFVKVESLCRFVDEEKWYRFVFRDRELTFVIPERRYMNNTEQERRLMAHYEIAHAFFLVEYEKEGFNPKEGETILDCGAADGDTAVLFSILYPTSSIYSFEYSKRTYEYLKKNLALNNILNVETRQTFLYKKTAKCWMTSSFCECNQNEEGCIEVDTLSIDDFVEENNIKNIGLIKMDIEGGEIPALEGAKRTIEKFRPLLYLPIYHLESDIYTIPNFLKELNADIELSFKWTEKLVWGVDGVLFVKFKEEV